jgi:hypothetical protein
MLMRGIVAGPTAGGPRGRRGDAVRTLNLPRRSNAISTPAPRVASTTSNGALFAAIRQLRNRPVANTPSGENDIVGNRRMSEMQYPSSDGRQIPCRLSMPAGDGPFPIVSRQRDHRRGSRVLPRK